MPRVPWPGLASFPAEPDPEFEKRVSLDRRSAVLLGSVIVLVAGMVIGVPGLLLVMMLRYGAFLDHDETSCTGRAAARCGPERPPQVPSSPRR